MQRKAERLERQRDDPFYITDRPSGSRPANGHAATDVDAIPIVRLEDMPSPALTPARTPLLREPAAPAPASFVVDRAGAMPRNAVSPSPVASGPGTPALVGTPRTPSGFPEYDVADADEPAPIKVTRKKKKGEGKPKRAKAPAEAEPVY
jgi:AP-3 complex subunit delta-1